MSPRQLDSSLARVRKMSRQLDERDRPFSPERPGSWRGSSRDLVVNGKPRMYVGHALALRQSDGYDWDHAPDSAWYRESVDKTQVNAAEPVGQRLIRGEEHVVFACTYTGDRRVYFYAQLASDVGSMNRNGGEQLYDGYAFQWNKEPGRTWKTAPNDDWDTEMVTQDDLERGAKFVGHRRIDGTQCAVFEVPGGEIYYAQTAMTRNGEVDSRDIPAHLHGAELRDEPEHNGQDVGYSQGMRGKSAEWFQVEYATGSDYSGGSVHESNYQVLCEMLEEHHPEDAQPVVWAHTSGGHGTYGIVVRYGDLEDEVREAIDALEDYPLMDEEHHSHLEMEQQQAAWEDWGVSELSKAVANETGVDVDELRDNLTDEDWFHIFNLVEAQGSITWEDQQGSGQYIDMKAVARQVIRYLEKGMPSYATPEQDKAYELLGNLVGAPEE